MVKTQKSPSLNSFPESMYHFSMDVWKHHRWELFIFVSLIALFICWIFKTKDSYNGFYIDTSVLKKKKIVRFKNEEKCREIIESIYNRPFKKIRPIFLKNHKTGRNLELDMYNEDLKLALEYNGIQHRVYAPYFHKSYSDYLDQVDRDEMKRQKCKEMGITLIEVPDTVRYHELEKHIKSELKKCGRL